MRKAGNAVKQLTLALAGAALSWAFAQQALAQHAPGPRFTRPGPARPAQPPQQIPARDLGPPHALPQRDPRMSPEERRQLRRDVHDHGQDIYRDRGARRP